MKLICNDSGMIPNETYSETMYAYLYTRAFISGTTYHYENSGFQVTVGKMRACSIHVSLQCVGRRSFEAAVVLPYPFKRG